MRLYYCVILLASALAPAAQAQFLVPDQQYRCAPSNARCRGAHKPPAFELGLSDYKHSPYTINYVEYNDKSGYWDEQELKDSVNQVTAAEDGRNQSPLVVVYVHGWQNNASDVSGDVVKFRGLMSRLADEYPVGLPGKAPQVVGIYLAWRGLTFTVEPFKHIVSYWPRRQIAKKLGQIGVRDAVCRVESAIHDNRSNTVLILAGHSFGARALENAIEISDPSGRCPTMQDYFDQLHTLAARGHASVEEIHNLPDLPADLIVYVNAATSSEKSRERVAQIRHDCPRASSAAVCSADPLYIAFTSTNDLATGLLMPIANLVFPDLRSDKLHPISAADSPWMHTHHAPEPGCPDKKGTCFTIAGEKTEPVQYHLPRIAGKAEVPGVKGNRSGTDPFWIFNVHSNLVNGHGDVWNPNVENMLTAILRNNGRFQHVTRAAAIAAAQ